MIVFNLRKLNLGKRKGNKVHILNITKCVVDENGSGMILSC